MSPVFTGTRNIRGEQEFLDIMLANYREKQKEGLKLVHSAFSDLAIIIGLIGVVIGGKTVTDEPRLLLVIPILLVCFGLYIIQKFRVSNLITSYLIYLEEQINKLTKRKVMVWNSEIISKKISAGRSAKSGNLQLLFITIIIIFVYGCACYWVYSANVAEIKSRVFGTTLYILFFGAILLAQILSLYSAMKVLRTYTPEDINKQIQQASMPGKKSNKNK
jgi:SNF family Na+-dependent transporter